MFFDICPSGVGFQNYSINILMPKQGMLMQRMRLSLNKAKCDVFSNALSGSAD
jgi:hypothetical protein